MKIYVVAESAGQYPGIFIGPDTGTGGKYVHIWSGGNLDGKCSMSLDYTEQELIDMEVVELEGLDGGALCKVLLEIAKERGII